jgi:hypothetical protein
LKEAPLLRSSKIKAGLVRSSDVLAKLMMYSIFKKIMTDGLQTNVGTVDFVEGGPTELMRYCIKLITYTQKYNVRSYCTSRGTYPFVV